MSILNNKQITELCTPPTHLSEEELAAFKPMISGYDSTPVIKNQDINSLSALERFCGLSDYAYYFRAHFYVGLDMRTDDTITLPPHRHLIVNSLEILNLPENIHATCMGQESYILAGCD